MDHELKSWPRFFSLLASGKRTFDLRKDDRKFSVGDILLLREYNPDTQTYSGRAVRKLVTYILAHDPDARCAATFGLHPGHVIMGLTNITESAGLFEVREDSRGNKLYMEPNGAGGHRYWSDEIGGGVVVWDTSLVSVEMLRLAIANEEKLGESFEMDKCPSP